MKVLARFFRLLFHRAALSILLLPLSSCSIYTRIDNLGQHKIKDEIRRFKSYCENNQAKIQLIGQEQRAQEIFRRHILKNKKSFSDFAMLWTLFQMYIRPDVTGPDAKFQALIKYQGKISYILAIPEDPQRPQSFSTLMALEDLRSKLGAQRSLLSYAEELDRKLPSHLPLDKNFVTTIEKESHHLRVFPFWASQIFRGRQVVREGESLQRFKLAALLRKIKFQQAQENTEHAKKKIAGPPLARSFKGHHLFASKNGPLNYACTFDSALYDQSIYLSGQVLDTPYHAYGIGDDESNQILVVQSMSIDWPNQQFAPLFRASGHPYHAHFCYRKNSKNNEHLIAASLEGNDTGQFLYHFLQNVSPLDQLEELNVILDSPRQIILPGPQRLVIESHRTSEEQIQRFRKLQIPIYHFDPLGKIWLHYFGPSFQGSFNGFVSDGRYETGLDCGPSGS